MYDLEVSSLSNHEKKVLNALGKFVNTYRPGASLSAIDDIVLSYVVGVLEDITSDDEFDVDSFVEMIAAYIPGFEEIEVAVVCEWMFALSSQLLKKDEENLPDEVAVPDMEPEAPSVTETTLPKKCHEEPSDTGTKSDDISDKSDSHPEKVGSSTSEDDDADVGEDHLSSLAEDLEIWDQNVTSGFQKVTTCGTEDQCQQILEVVPNASLEEVRESLYQSGGDLEQAVENLMDRMVLQETSQSQIKGELDFRESPDSQVVFITKSKRSEQKRKRHRRKNTKEKDVTSQDDQIVDRPLNKSDVTQNQISDGNVNRDGIQHLLELFPSASSMDAQHCLAIANGDIEGAAQLLLERVNSGEIQPKPIYPKLQKPRAVDEKKQRELLLQKYAFVDTEEDKKDHRPFLPKPSKKKMVRYFDSKPVTLKGERFFEVKDS